jgi:hypothetical protein
MMTLCMALCRVLATCHIVGNVERDGSACPGSALGKLDIIQSLDMVGIARRAPPKSLVLPCCIDARELVSS